MLFHEIYGSYYNVIAKVLKEAVQGSITSDERIKDIVREKAFSESIFDLPEKVKNWNLISDDYIPLVYDEPQMPLTLLQKRWLKALLSDPRIQLFEFDKDSLDNELENIKPLFTPETVVFFDKNNAGDPYGDPDYIQNFRLILNAVKEHRSLRFEYKSSKGFDVEIVGYPLYLEYSEKDDRFRAIVNGAYIDTGSVHRFVLNLYGIKKCEIYYAEEYNMEYDMAPSSEKVTITVILSDERNALERVLLHFSSYEKETKRISNDRYRLKITFDRNDETEILIRILSFGPMLKVVSPDDFVEKIKSRLKDQKSICKNTIQ